MASLQHEKIFRAGLNDWNDWRMKDNSAPDLSDLVFEGLDLTRYDLSHANLAGTEFRSCVLSFATFESARLDKGAVFSRIEEAVNVDFSRVVMNDVKMTSCKWGRAQFTDSCLENATFEECAFTDCHLERICMKRARWYDCTLVRCDFTGGDMTGVVFEAGALSEPPNKATNCVLAGVKFAEADLRGLIGYQFDHNHIRRALVAPHALDDWSVLRRSYTGTRLIFNLLFLACFFAPVVAKIIFWTEVSRLESNLLNMKSAVERIADNFERASSAVGREMAHAIRHAAEKIPVLRLNDRYSEVLVINGEVLPQIAAQLKADPGSVGQMLGRAIESAIAESGSARDARQTFDRIVDELARKSEADAQAVAQVLRHSRDSILAYQPRPSSLLITAFLGLNISWSNLSFSSIVGALTSMLLIAYNLARALLTYFVTQMRDEEKVTGFSPRRSWSKLWVRTPTPEKCGLARWLNSAWATARRMPEMLKQYYAWLLPAQKTVSALQYVAYSMTAIHAYSVLTGSVVFPN